MKANVCKLIGTAVMGLAMLLNSMPTWAGQRELPQVTVVSNGASGSMVGARYSNDSQQYIGCLFYETLIDKFVSCTARDRTGKTFTCSSYDPRWVTVVKAISDSSYIGLVGSNNGTCTSLTIENHSRYLK